MRTPILVAAAAVLAARVTAAPTVINFENLPTGTTVANQYSPQGVTFFGAYVQADSGAHSGTRVLRSHNPASARTPVPCASTSRAANVT
jgi:hypothetical protein